MNPLLLLKLKSLTVFFQKHWGKVVAVFFIAVWAIFTVSLYNINQNLHEELGASGAAISVCIAERNNMDNVLVRFKSELALIEADNAEYKARLLAAGITIKELENDIASVVADIDLVEIPIECENTFDWMLERAIK